MHNMCHFVTVLGLRLMSQPRIPQIYFLGWLVYDQTRQGQLLIRPLESIVVLSQPAEIGLDNRPYLTLTERLLVESAFIKFVFECVVILALEDEVVGLLV